MEFSVADGFAHGRAGIAYCLLAHAVASSYSESRRHARKLINELADLTTKLAVRVQSRLARPMSASWCQGLAGIGTTLVRGAEFFNDERLLEAARTAAVGCLAIAPRVPLVTQCCGLAGIGEFLLDLAALTGDIHYRQSALAIFNLMLIRSGGSRTALRSPESSIETGNPGWAAGTAGSFIVSASPGRSLESPNLDVENGKLQHQGLSRDSEEVLGRYAVVPKKNSGLICRLNPGDCWRPSATYSKSARILVPHRPPWC